jgi:hypothetical protein
MVEDERDIDLWARGMGKQAGEASVKGCGPKPKVESERIGGAISNNNLGR